MFYYTMVYQCRAVFNVVGLCANMYMYGVLNRPVVNLII